MQLGSSPLESDSFSFLQACGQLVLGGDEDLESCFEGGDQVRSGAEVVEAVGRIEHESFEGCPGGGRGVDVGEEVGGEGVVGPEFDVSVGSAFGVVDDEVLRVGDCKISLSRGFGLELGHVGICACAGVGDIQI